MSAEFHIRRATAADRPAIWRLLEPVFREGETCAVDPAITEHDALALWMDRPARVYVLETSAGEIPGTYYIKDNQSGPGDHVCNCGYIVDVNTRGKGYAGAMCEHSQQVAREMGYLAMQFNIVLASNERAVHLWTKHGFQALCRVPKAFRHPRLGLVDAFVMYKWLGEQELVGT